MAKSTITDLQSELAEKRKVVQVCEAALEKERTDAEEYVAKKVARAQAALEEARRDVDEYVSKVSSVLGIPDPAVARRTKLRRKKVRELLDQDKTAEEIARETGEPLEVVREDLARLDGSDSGEEGGAPQKRGWKREQVRRLLADGLTVEDVAGRLGMTVVNVRAHAYQLKLKGQLPEARSPVPLGKTTSPNPAAPQATTSPPPRGPGAPPATGDLVEALRAEVARQQGGQRAKAASLLTTPTHGHSHRVMVDRLGDGTTQVDETGHVHQVHRFVVSLAADHQHGLRAPSTAA
jgi:hypothetical protein